VKGPGKGVESGYQETARILVVDDEESVRDLIGQILGNHGYHCSFARDAKEARRILKEKEFELLFCDVNMPGESGLDLIKEIARYFPQTAFVMISGMDDPLISHAAIDMGAYGYILKPFGANELMINAKNALRRRMLEIQHKLHREELEREVRSRTLKLVETMNRLQRAFEGVTESFGLALEARDPYTAGHQRRVAQIATAIGIQMGLSEKEVEGINLSSLIHDIGKIYVPAEILAKPTRLTHTEFQLMKEHSRVGYGIMKNIEFPWPIAETIYQHHERMDGTGYPRGLKGNETLTAARVIAVADVVEAMASHRPYRPALGIDKALEELLKNKGVLYDLDVVKACLTVYEKKAFGLL
jgi:response regulator RpfG family c-di-GMP phosphodiesterase